MASSVGVSFLAGLAGLAKGMAQKRLLEEKYKNLQEIERAKSNKDATLEFFSNLAKVKDPQIQRMMVDYYNQQYGTNFQPPEPQQPSVAQSAVEQYMKLPATQREKLGMELGILEPSPVDQAKTKYWEARANNLRQQASGKLDEIGLEGLKQISNALRDQLNMLPNLPADIARAKYQELVDALNRVNAEIARRVHYQYSPSQKQGSQSAGNKKKKWQWVQ